MNSTQLVSLRDLQTDADDRKALHGVQAANRQSLETLYLGYYAPLARFLSRFVATTNAVDDIINQTFATIWTSAIEVRRESRVAVCIFGIAYKTARRSVRMNSGEACRFTGVAPGCKNDFETDKPGVDSLKHRLNRLSVEDRVTLILAYQMGFSVDEIASIIESTPGAVHMRMCRARASLRPIF